VKVYDPVLLMACHIVDSAERFQQWQFSEWRNLGLNVSSNGSFLNGGI